MAISNQAEKDFLKKLMVDQFNLQYKHNIDYSKCAIRSIDPTYGTEKGYEVETTLQADYVRMRFYFTFERFTVVNPYRIEVDKTFVIGSLGDEVYVSLGTVDISYVDNRIYTFRYLPEDETAYQYFDFVNGEHLDFITGEHIQLVDQS